MNRLSAALMALAPIAGLTSLSSTAPALGVGDQAPDWTLTDVRTGETLTLSDLRGQHVLLDFWATWCGPCRGAMQRELGPVHQLMGERDDWHLISVGVPGGQTPEVQRQYADDNGYDWTFVFDATGRTSQAYGVEGIPTMVWVNPQGVIEALDHHGVGRQMAQELASVSSLVPPRADLGQRATAIPDSGTVEGQVAQGSDMVYAFSAPSAGRYIFQTVGGERMDTVLAIHDEAGQSLGENDDDGTSFNSRVELDLQAGARVFVVVSGFNGMEGRFALTVTGADAPGQASPTQEAR